MNKIVFDSYMGPGLSPIKYGTAHDNYLKKLPLINYAIMHVNMQGLEYTNNLVKKPCS